MDNTYVKLYRSLLDHDTLSNDNTALIVFVKLLLKVNRHTGSLITGRFKLAAMTNLKPSTCWGALRRLETDSIVTLSPTGRYTTIHICNWHDYQTADRAKTDSKPTPSRAPTDTITRTKNKNNIITPATADVVALFSYWKEQTGVEIASKIPTNQKTCQGLIDVHGMETMKGLIRSVKQAQASKYAPRISDFVQLNARLTELVTWCKIQAAPAHQTTPTSSAKPVTWSSSAAAARKEISKKSNMTRKELQEAEYPS